MVRISWMLVCVAYVIGLGLTGLPMPIVGVGGLVGLLGIGGEWASRRFFPGQLPIRTGWLVATIALFALGHYQVRLPQPSAQDVSQFIDVLRSQPITVRGTVLELPRLTRSQNMQIWLQVQGLDAGAIAPQLSQSPTTARGRLYVTVAQGEGADVHPGQSVRIQGQLYRPQPARNPGGFDFAQFLRQQNCFAGLRAETLRAETIQQVSSPPSSNGSSSPWGLWQLQRRIVRSQAAQLPNPEGALLSAMVLGGKVVDLPFELKDQFARVGLSHALAASGFQVSLILGVVLAATKRLSVKWQIIAGSTSILIFLGLTGLQPSVCRAVVMGLAVLWAIAAERKINPIGSLLFAVTFLLLLNPLWVWDLGFQLSVLATLGLVVTVPWLTGWLDWLPNFLATAIAVPLAALIWTLPLQLQAFGVVSPYCLLANILSVPLIEIISLGGMLNALLAAISPVWGSWTAAGLHWPIWGLIAGVNFFASLPGSTIAIGTIPVLLMALLYGLMALLWGQPDWRCYGWAFGAAGAAMVWLPSWQWQSHLTQITALVTADQPVVVVQSHDRTGLINSGWEQTTTMTVLPFLQQQGVNQLDWAVALTADRQGTPPDQVADHADQSVVSGWSVLSGRLKVNHLYHMTPAPPLSQSQELDRDRSIAAGDTRLERLSSNGLSVQVEQMRWLLLGHAADRQSSQRSGDQAQSGDQAPRRGHRAPVEPTPEGSLPPQFTAHQVLCWPGGRLNQEIIRQVQPQVAIAYGKRLDPGTEAMLRAQGTQVYWLKRDGAVQWQPKIGFRGMDDARSFLL